MNKKIPMYSEWKRKDGTGTGMKVTGFTKTGRVLFHPTSGVIVRGQSLDEAKFLETYEKKS